MAKPNLFRTRRIPNSVAKMIHLERLADDAHIRALDRKAARPRCQMTMESRSTLGVAYFECEKPAKFILEDRMRGPITVCGIHARNKRGRITPIGGSK